MLNRLDPDQARHFVGPDLGPNCLQKLSADDTRRQRVKGVIVQLVHVFFCGLMFQSTAMVMSRQSVNLTTHFLGKLTLIC